MVSGPWLGAVGRLSEFPWAVAGRSWRSGVGGIRSAGNGVNASALTAQVWESGEKVGSVLLSGGGGNVRAGEEIDIPSFGAAGQTNLDLNAG